MALSQLNNYGTLEEDIHCDNDLWTLEEDIHCFNFYTHFFFVCIHAIYDLLVSF